MKHFMKITAVLFMLGISQFGFAGEGKDNKPLTGHVYFTDYLHWQPSGEAVFICASNRLTSTSASTTSVSTGTAQSTETASAGSSAGSSTKKKIIMLTSKGGGCRRMKITTKPTEMPSEEDLEIYGPEAVLGSWASYINNPTIVALIMAYVGKQASRN